MNSSNFAFRFVETVERKDATKDFATMADLRQSELNFSRSQNAGNAKSPKSSPKSANEVADATPLGSVGGETSMSHLSLQTTNPHLQQQQQQLQNLSSAYVDSLQTGASGLHTNTSSHSVFPSQTQNEDQDHHTQIQDQKQRSCSTLYNNKNNLDTYFSNINPATGCQTGSFTDLIQSLQLRYHHHQHQQQQEQKKLQLSEENQKQQQPLLSSLSLSVASPIAVIQQPSEQSSASSGSSASASSFFGNFAPDFASYLQQTVCAGPTTTSEVYALACEKYGCGTNTGIAKQFVEVDLDHVEWISEQYQRFHQLLLELNEKYVAGSFSEMVKLSRDERLNLLLNNNVSNKQHHNQHVQHQQEQQPQIQCDDNELNKSGDTIEPPSMTRVVTTTSVPGSADPQPLPLRRRWRPVTLDDIQQILKQDSSSTTSSSSSSPLSSATSHHETGKNTYLDLVSGANISGSHHHHHQQQPPQQQEQQERQGEKLAPAPVESSLGPSCRPHGAIRPLVTSFDLGNRNILNWLSLHALLDVCVICFPNLTRLTIGDVGLDEKSIRVLGDAVDKMHNLTSIDLRGNKKLFASSARHLVEMVERNPRILEVRVDSENVPKRILTALKIAIATNTARKCPIFSTMKKALNVIPVSVHAPENENANNRIVPSSSGEDHTNNNNNKNKSNNNKNDENSKKNSSPPSPVTSYLIAQAASAESPAEPFSNEESTAVMCEQPDRAEKRLRRRESQDDEEKADAGVGRFVAAISLRPRPPPPRLADNAQDQQQKESFKRRTLVLDTTIDHDNNNNISNNNTTTDANQEQEDDEGGSCTEILSPAAASASPTFSSPQQQQQQQQQPTASTSASPSPITRKKKYGRHILRPVNEQQEEDEEEAQIVQENEHPRFSSSITNIRDTILRIGQSAIQLASDLGDDLFEKKFAKHFLLNEKIVASEIRPTFDTCSNYQCASGNVDYLDLFAERLEKRRQYLLRMTKHLDEQMSTLFFNPEQSSDQENNYSKNKPNNKAINLFALDETDSIVTRQFFKRIYLLLEPWRIDKTSLLRHASLLLEVKQEEEIDAVYLASKPSARKLAKLSLNATEGNDGASSSSATATATAVVPVSEEADDNFILDASLARHFDQRRKLEQELERRRKKVENEDHQIHRQSSSNNDNTNDTRNNMNQESRLRLALPPPLRRPAYDHCDDPEQDFPTSNRSLGVAALREAAKLLNAIRNKVLGSVIHNVALDTKRILFNNKDLRSTSLLAAAAHTGRSATVELRAYLQCTGEWGDDVNDDDDDDEEEEANSKMEPESTAQRKKANKTGATNEMSHSRANDDTSDNNDDTSNNTTTSLKSPIASRRPPPPPPLLLLPSLTTQEGIAAHIQTLEDYLIEKHVKISRRLVLLHDRMSYLEHEFKSMNHECTNRYRSVTPFPFVVNSNCYYYSPRQQKLQNHKYERRQRDGEDDDRLLLLIKRETASVRRSSYSAERRNLFRELFSLFPSSVSNFFLELFTSRIVTRWQNMQDVTDVTLAMSSTLSSNSNSSSASAVTEDSLHLLSYIAEDVLSYQKQQDRDCCCCYRDDNNNNRYSSDTQQDENLIAIAFPDKVSAARGTSGLLAVSFVDSLLPAQQQRQQQQTHSFLDADGEADLFDLIKRCIADEEAIRRTVVAIVCRKALKDIFGQ